MAFPCSNLAQKLQHQGGKEQQNSNRSGDEAGHGRPAVSVDDDLQRRRGSRMRCSEANRARKTKGSRRILPLPRPMVRTLSLLRPNPGEGADETLVFHTRKGTALSDTNLLHRHLKPAGQKIGTPWLSWHTLRRTHATMLQAAGGSIKDAQAQLGHSKLSTTLEIYTFPLPDHQRAVVENLARMVTNGERGEPSVEELRPATQQIQ